MGYTTYRPRECQTEQGPCIQRQQGGKDNAGDQHYHEPHRDIAFGRYAGPCLCG
jgi:hypothetical protein